LASQPDNRRREVAEKSEQPDIADRERYYDEEHPELVLVGLSIVGYSSCFWN